MDFHFIKPSQEIEPERTSVDFKKLLATLKTFIPLFVLAVMLPVLVGLVMAPPDIGFFTRADSEPTLRLWFEPAKVVVAPDNSVEVVLWADFEADSGLIPEISLPLVTTGSISISQSSVLYPRPFSGKVELARIPVSAETQGQGTLQINKDSIEITAFDGPIEILTGELTVFVQ